METGGGFIQYTTGSLLFLAIFAGNLLLWQSPIIGGILLVFFLLFFGLRLGAHGPAALIAVLSLLGAGAYYLDALSQTTIAVIVILTPLVVWTLAPQSKSPFSHLHFPLPLSNLYTPISISILTISAITLLLQNQITSPVRSPWLVIPAVFLLVIFLIALLVVAKPNKWAITLFFFLTISVALFTYPLGYGFDGFIHRATEQHILDYGSISPKPLYYAGQYGLVLFTAHGFALPIDLVDTLLVPLLAALLIPLAAYNGFKKLLGRTHGSAPTIALLSLFLVPLSSFITTTPQALANVWTLMAMFAAMPRATTSDRPYVAMLFAAAALATHPLAGIPIVIYLVLSYKPKAITAILCSLALPIIFIVNSAISRLPLTIRLPDLQSLTLDNLFGLRLFAANHFNPFLDAAYLFGWNRILILLIMIVAGIILLRRSNLHSPFSITNFQSPLTIFLLPSLVLLVNYILLSTIFRFYFLIGYEQGNYAARVFETAQFFLIPLLGFVLVRLFDLVETKPIAIRAGVTVLTAIILTSTVYLTYPRHDNYEISRGFNVGASDFDTVRYINEQNASINYIVLANQAVSSAAMKEYGFIKYFNDDVFYYPIPTGGQLYQFYLDMVNVGPTRLKAIEAMDLAGVDKAYLVVNDYWFLADKIIENAKREATSWIAIDDGTAYVFEYRR